jgi:hypothetical protein
VTGVGEGRREVRVLGAVAVGVTELLREGASVGELVEVLGESHGGVEGGGDDERGGGESDAGLHCAAILWWFLMLGLCFPKAN